MADPQHLPLECPIYTEERRRAFGEEPPLFTRIVTKPGLTRKVARWAISTGEFDQFKLAASLNYREELERL